jgi:threonine/homoserine/homoserine lactone efflux protein
MSPRTRLLLSRALAVLAAFALVLAVAASYARSVVVSSDQFADRASVALHNSSVRSLIADSVTDDLVLRNSPNLIAARPLIRSVVSSVVASDAFAGLFRAGVRDLHRAVLHHDRNTLTLTVVDVGTVAAAALETLKPSLAQQVRSTRAARLLRDNVGSVPATVLRIADDVRLLAILLGILALLGGGGAVALATDRRRACAELGVAVAVAGLVLIVVLAIGEQVARGQVSSGPPRAAVGAVYDAFLDDLRTEAWIIAGIGAVFAAAAASLIRPIPIDEPLRRAGRWLVTEPRRPWARALRGIALLVAGAFVVLEQAMALTLVLTAIGVYLIYSGVYVLLSMINRPAEAQPAAERPGRRRAHRRGLIVAAGVVVIALGAALGGFFGSGGVKASAPDQASCNDSLALCGAIAAAGRARGDAQLDVGAVAGLVLA